ncbi:MULTISPECIES: SpoIIE family protein phosphatase [Leptospira]|uniref:Stage II sporulation protein E n=4 Tax=Leptospira borgpetersenii TaxID=174 RepID=M3GTL4_LEPBO|nr:MULTISPECIES: SpoIIE family protein phosphatase [Leptospira]EMF98158.1 stage II sporulation protein E [Leptospira borgpetersenii str. 200701203]AXX17521.1 serine/threonine protein phosphatase [Leptospira borgpetersenii serovar Ceylonica]EKP11603.1 stage II sporulation protein E [Leptospira borgpetersenii str. 200801926]EMK11389.1 stage II sporulation protein E [Leptospira sp. serovar Kenya str. Sh9]EMN14788.1 stage II sporulation protein E [Leptospira borgpetersenii str. Brem 307]
MSERQLSLSLISNITAKINSTDNLEELLNIIIETTKDVLNTEGCSLLLYDRNEDCLVFNIAKGTKEKSLTELKVPRGKGIAGMVLETLEPVIVNDAKNDSRIYRNIDETVGFVTYNLICVPMSTQGEIQGVLEAVNSLERKEFTNKDIKILQYLSDLAAIAIRNRRLIRDLKSRANELDCLFQLSQAISNISEMDQFFNLTVNSVSEIMGAERVSLIFFNPKNGKYELKKSIGFSLKEEEHFINEKEGVIRKVIETGKPILVQNTSSIMEDCVRPERYKTKSFISVPIRQDGKIIGILNSADKKSGNNFDNADQNVLSTISNQIAEAYNSLLSKEQKEKLNSIHRDMQIASQIQVNSLPNIPKKIQGLELETSYIASKEIGGDFYDLIYHNPDEVSVLIADVSGKGIAAALFMEFSKTIIAGEVSRNSSTSISLMSANRIIQEKSGYFMFVTVMLARINMAKRKIRYSSAGHNEQLLYKAKEKNVVSLSGKGMPLGIKESEIDEHELDYYPGDLLILYTDGVSEAMNESNEMYGLENLTKLIERNGDMPLGALKELIIDTTDAFRGDADPHDDYTLFMIRLP